MPPFHMRLDIQRQHRTFSTHFTHPPRIPACDHCTYFNGIFYRSLSRQHLNNEEELATRHNNLAPGPRFLLSVVLEEVIIEKRSHAQYMAWSRSTQAIDMEAKTHETNKTAKSIMMYSEKSDTLSAWIEGSTKEGLLAWLERNRNEGDDMTTLRQESIFDLRKYIMHRSNNKKLIDTTQQFNCTINASMTASATSRKKGNPRRDATA
jgi:hypothetical protein